MSAVDEKDAILSLLSFSNKNGEGGEGPKKRQKVDACGSEKNTVEPVLNPEAKELDHTPPSLSTADPKPRVASISPQPGVSSVEEVQRQVLSSLLKNIGPKRQHHPTISGQFEDSRDHLLRAMLPHAVPVLGQQVSQEFPSVVPPMLRQKASQEATKGVPSPPALIAQTSVEFAAPPPPSLTQQASQELARLASFRQQRQLMEATTKPFHLPPHPFATAGAAPQGPATFQPGPPRPEFFEQQAYMERRIHSEAMMRAHIALQQHGANPVAVAQHIEQVHMKRMQEIDRARMATLGASATAKPTARPAPSGVVSPPATTTAEEAEHSAEEGEAGAIRKAAATAIKSGMAYADHPYALRKALEIPAMKPPTNPVHKIAVDTKEDTGDGSPRSDNLSGDDSRPAKKRGSSTYSTKVRYEQYVPPTAWAELAAVPKMPYTPADDDMKHAIKTVGANDVLLGRGGLTNTNAGNVKFRALVSKYRLHYCTAPKGDKGALSRYLCNYVRANNGRFLRKDEKDDKWYEAGDEKAVMKCGQALREGTGNMIRKALGPDQDMQTPSTGNDYVI